MSPHLENQTAGCCQVVFRTFSRVHWLIVSDGPNTRSLTPLDWYNYSRISCCLRLTANSCCGSFGSLKRLLCPFSLGAVNRTVWFWSSSNFRWSSPSSSPFQKPVVLIDLNLLEQRDLITLCWVNFGTGKNSPQNFPSVVVYLCLRAMSPPHTLPWLRVEPNSPGPHPKTKQQFFQCCL